MKRKMRQAVSCVLIAVLMGLLIPCFVPSASAQQTYKGSDFTANEYIASRLDVVFSEYPVGSYYTFDGKECTHHGQGCSYYGGCNCRSFINDPEKRGEQVRFNSIQCMGYAHYTFYKLFGFIDRSEFDTSLYYSIGNLSSAEMTAENCKKLILQAQTGAHIRIANKHSMVYLSGDGNGFTVIHCNADASCGISVKTWTWSEFASSFQGWGIGYINVPKTYPNSSGTSTIAASRPQYSATSSVTLNWTAVAGVTGYSIKIYSYQPVSKTETLVKTIDSLTGNTTTVSELNENTTYRAYIYCGNLTKPDSYVEFYVAPSYTGVVSKTVREGTFSLKNLALSKTMDVSSISQEGVSVNLAAFNGAATQQFYFSYAGDGMYRIYSGSADNTKVLTTMKGTDQTGSAEESIKLSEKTDTNSYCQLFYVVESSGNYYLESVSRPGYVINASIDGCLSIKPRAQSVYYLWQFCDNSGTAIDPTDKSSKYIVGSYTITTESTSLNIRSGAGTSYNKIGSVPKDVTVLVTVVENDWGYITYNQISGWISMEYTTLISFGITDISIATQPTKLVYELNEKIDSAGLSIKVTRSDGTSSVISSGFELSYDFSTAGNKTVVVTYQGKTTTYPVSVSGGLPSAMTSTVYSINADKGTVTNVSANVTLDEFLGGFYAADYIKVYRGETEISASDKIGTGMTIKLTDGKTVAQSLTVIVTGDANGDGTINITDMIQVKAHMLGTKLLIGNALIAADTSNDTKVNITDFVQIKGHILAKSSVKPHA